MPKLKKDEQLNIGEHTFMGYSDEAYAQLPIYDKIDYVLGIADKYTSPKIAQFIREHYKISTRIYFQEPAKGGVEGLSRFGGLPLAPAGFEYPKDAEGNPALFIAQIHIGEFNQWHISTREFKGQGVIYFFGTIVGEYGSHHLKEILVRYSDQISEVQEIPLPEGLKDFGTYPEMDLMIFEEMNIPGSQGCLVDHENLIDDDEVLYDEIEEILNSFYNPESFRLLGHPNSVQHCVQFEAERKQQKVLFYRDEEFDNDSFMEGYLKLRPLSLDWRLLLELDAMAFPKLPGYNGDFNAGMDGVFFVMIREKDLEDMRLEEVVSVYQST